MLPPIDPLELARQIKHYDDNLGPRLLATTYALVACATVTTALRFWARHISGARLLADDWTILCSLACMWGLGAVGVISVRDGLGRHAVRVGLAGISKFLLSGYIYEQIYVVGVSITKISILLFYLRLFLGRRFKRLVYCVGVFTVLWTITTIIPAIFQCRPIHYFWNRNIDGKCINSPALIISTAVTNVITDLIIWIMPFPILWKLHLPFRQRIAICGIFLLGGFVCIAGIIRLRFLAFVSDTTDPTYKNAPGGLWSLVESCIGVTCANTPMFRPLVRHYISDPIRSTRSTDFSSSNKDPHQGKDKGIPPNASAIWFSQGSTQVSSTTQRDVKVKSPILSSYRSSHPPESAKPVIWGGRIFRPHKDSLFADLTQGSAAESRNEEEAPPATADSISESIPPNAIRVRKEVMWASSNEPWPLVPPLKPTLKVPQRRTLSFDETIRRVR